MPGPDMGVERSSNMVLLVDGGDASSFERTGLLPFIAPRRFTLLRASKISASECALKGSKLDRRVPEKRKGC